MAAERAFWLTWSQIDGIGPILLRRLQKHFGTLTAAWEAAASALLEVEGLGPQTVETAISARRQIDPESWLQQHEQANPCFWTPADEGYPHLLLEIPDPPPVLYYRGQVDWLENRGITPLVAIVGTRAPSDYGRRWTRRITTALVNNGFTIVSGLAEGIDTEAHRTCLEREGRTIAVLGTGVNVVYPWSNRTLQHQVVNHGLLLSEYPAGTQPDRVHFPRRNRIIAGLSRATIVLEAPQKSGALITAYLANEYGRDVYALPGSLDNRQAIGCINLISKGAQPFVDEENLLDLLGSLPQLNPPASTSQIPLPLNLAPELEQVLQTLSQLAQNADAAAIPFDLIAQNSQLPAGAISSALLQLELLGLVSQQPGMRYQRQ